MGTMKSEFRRTLCFFLLIFCSLGVFATDGLGQSAALQAPVSSRIETANFGEVFTRVKELVESQGAENVLFVVDIDNTLLAMNQDLGSDQWFNWQSELLNKSPDSPDLVASDIEGLLRVQGTLFALSRMHPPEPMIPAVVQGVQLMECKSIVLTSRGPEFRDAAERSLRAVRHALQGGHARLELADSGIQGGQELGLLCRQAVLGHGAHCLLHLAQSGRDACHVAQSLQR